MKPDAIVFEKTCSLRDHQICEVIDSDMVSVIDFQVNSRVKLYNVTKNRVTDLPQRFHYLNNTTGQTRSRTFASSFNAFSLSATEQSLSFHYDADFKSEAEIVNHDCMDFVFYQNKEKKSIKVLSFIEQNDQYRLQVDEILEMEEEANGDENIADEQHQSLEQRTEGNGQDLQLGNST